MLENAIVLENAWTQVRIHLLETFWWYSTAMLMLGSFESLACVLRRAETLLLAEAAEKAGRQWIGEVVEMRSPYRQGEGSRAEGKVFLPVSLTPTRQWRTRKKLYRGRKSRYKHHVEAPALYGTRQELLPQEPNKPI